MKTTLTSIFLIIILGFIVYSNSLDGKFVTDDFALVKDNIYIKDRAHLPKIFSKDIKIEGEKKYYYYRPVPLVTYMIDYSLWRLDVRGYHFSNTLFHILVALAIYWLMHVFFKDNILSLLTSILFIVHPIHTEAVAYISGRADLLAVLFMLLSFIFYVKYLDSKNIKTYILMSASYLSAIL